MKKKTISRVITKKMTNWVNTLPKEMRKEVMDSIIVTGGCIVSYFLDQDVNDYDVYFKDINVLEKVAKYYLKKGGVNGAVYVMNGKSPDEDDLQRFGIKGVALRNTSTEQVKLFFNNKDGGLHVNGKLRKAGKEQLKSERIKDPLPVYLSPNSIMLSNKVQIVCRFTGDVTQIHKNFDFIHTTNYWTKATGLVVNEEALSAILTKSLVYQGSLYPLTSVIRIRKFLQRGWTISAGQILKILFQVSKLDLSNVSVLEDQLIGVDIALFDKLISAISKITKDGEEIKENVFNDIIDNLFQDNFIDDSELDEDDEDTDEDF